MVYLRSPFSESESIVQRVSISIIPVVTRLLYSVCISTLIMLNTVQFTLTH